MGDVDADGAAAAGEAAGRRGGRINGERGNADGGAFDDGGPDWATAGGRVLHGGAAGAMEKGKEEQKMTNAEKIRSMTDEELAQLLNGAERTGAKTVTRCGKTEPVWQWNWTARLTCTVLPRRSGG